jgi:pyruvate dehydrogenase complex dehydrogenase (E1) component
LKEEAVSPQAKASRPLPPGPFLRSASAGKALAAVELLARERQVEAELWSATSFSERAREVERWNRLQLHAAE